MASWFEVFNSHGAFDVILGKPWLTQVKATHDYDTDQLSITNNGATDTLSNEASVVRTEEPEPTPTNTPVMPVTVDPETPPEDQLDSEWLRIHQIQASDSPWKETRWAKYLDLDPLETDSNDDNGLDSWSTDFQANLFNEDSPPITEREQRSQQLESLRQQRDIEGEILLTQSIQEYNEERERIRLSTPKSKSK